MQLDASAATQTVVSQQSLYRSRGEAGPSSGSAFASTLTDALAFGRQTAAAVGTRVLAPPETRGQQSTARDAFLVSAANRHKYFKRPIIPFMSAQPPEVLFASAGEAAMAPPEPVAEPLAKDAACQSDYREADVQTDPYTPDYVVAPGEDPELLTLAALKHGTGLPAGLAEVKMIERARQKRQFEASLPPITDEASLLLRRKMMSEQELREWNVREEETFAQHDEKLDLFEAELRRQAEAREQHWDERIEHERQIKLTEKDKEISQIQRRRIKALRKLSEARKSVEKKREKRDIIGEYADYGSEVYAPLTRHGYVTRDKLAAQFETKPLQLESLAGLQELEASMPASMLEAQVTRPAKAKAVGYAARKVKQLQENLQHTDAAIKAAKQAKPSEKEQKEALLAAYRDTKPVERPPTPSVAEPDVDDEVECAAILLQRLMRGRAIQNAMFEGKERRLELIKELRTEETLGSDEGDDEAAASAMGEAYEGLVDGLLGELVGGDLDAMAKELRRFKEERRIAELVEVAETTRRTREAEESGRRQKELARRAEAQECFRQLMRVHNASAASYISEILTEVVSASTSAQAHAEVLGAAAAASERPEDRGATTEAIVNDLVDNFVFPEVARQMEMRDAAFDETKFAHATAKALANVVADVEAAIEKSKEAEAAE